MYVCMYVSMYVCMYVSECLNIFATGQWVPIPVAWVSHQYTHVLYLWLAISEYHSFSSQKITIVCFLSVLFFILQIKPHWCGTSRSPKFDHEFGSGVDTKWNKNQLCNSSKFY